MKTPPFDYVVATDERSAIGALIHAKGDGKILAGGQSLLPVLAMRLTRPKILVDITRIPGWGSLVRDGDRMHIGALVRHCELLRQTDVPLLAEAARWIGHTAIRSRGTAGGSIAHADPSAELPVVAAALDAVITVVGPHGSRSIDASDFFTSALETSLEESEIVRSIDIPLPTTWGFAEFSRRHGDFGLVTVVAAEVEGSWRICIGGVATVPHRAIEAEGILDSGPLSTERISVAAKAAAASVTTSTDIHASAGYRQAMTEEFTRRALISATSTALIGAES